MMSEVKVGLLLNTALRSKTCDYVYGSFLATFSRIPLLPTGTHFKIPYLQEPVIYDVKMQAHLVPVVTPSRG